VLLGEAMPTESYENLPAHMLQHFQERTKQLRTEIEQLIAELADLEHRIKNIKNAPKPSKPSFFCCYNFMKCCCCGS
jgi:hypothetical protein